MIAGKDGDMNVEVVKKSQIFSSKLVWYLAPIMHLPFLRYLIFFACLSSYTSEEDNGE